jgi:hypothetical protein
MSIASRQIHLNSQYAEYKAGNEWDCIFKLGEITVLDGHYIHLTITHCVIPYSFYNINSYNSFVVYYQYISNVWIQTAFYIDEGNYNINQLITYLKTQMLNINITYDIIKNKLTFTNSLYEFKFDTQTTGLSLFGFSNNNAYLLSTNKVLTSNKVVSLSSHMCICLASNDFMDGDILSCSLNSSSILASVSLAGYQPNSLIEYKNMHDYKFNTYHNYMNSLSLRLINQSNHNIDLNGCYFNVTIQIDAIPFGEI